LQVGTRDGGIGKRIQQVRKRKGWTLDQLARESGVTKGFLSQVENTEDAGVGGKVLFRIARALGASTDWLLGGDEVGAVAEQPQPVQVPPELAQLAIERKWSAQKVFQVLGAHSDLLARRSDKPRRTVLTRTEWAEFAERVEPYLNSDKGED
jgi:transcriptional regulator with XRE-family HTH domain